MRLICTALALVVSLAVVGAQQAANTLDIYFVDTEGGQATLLVPAGGESLLIDAGYAGLDTNNPDEEAGRDAERIAAVAKLAGLSRIDVFVPSHFHGDHVGGIEHLAARIPIGAFVDDGPSVQNVGPLRQVVGQYSEIYEAEFAKGRHSVVKAGDTIAVKGLSVSVVASNGRPVARTGQPNPYCEGITRRQDGNPENAESMGILVQFGSFRYLNVGDMPFNNELDMLCPNNKVGQIDVYQAGHGGERSRAVAAMAPRIAVGPNGARKGAGPAAVNAYRSLPGFEDFWLMHFNVPAGQEGNPPSGLIANLDEHESGVEGHYLKLSALEDGSFMMFNSRTSATKRYAARN
jgi:competence protein ComEC